MNNNTKQTIFTFAKRAAFLFSVAFLIFSCNPDDDDNFDCENLEANFGDSCDSAGVVSLDCICITTLEEDTTGMAEYDCPAWELNIGDACADGTDINGNILVEGFLDANCNCIPVQDTTIISSFDCPDLLQNFGDSCATWTPDSVYVYGIIDMNCECN